MFRELFDSAPDAMVAVDRAGRIVRANAQALSLFGYAGAELNGAAIEILVPKHAHAAHVRHRNGFIASPRSRPMGVGQELSAVRRDGEEFPVEIALSPINTPDGQMFVASIRDISETHRARQALLRARYDAFVAQIGRLVLAAPNLDAAIAHIPELVADALHVSAVAITCRQVQGGSWQVRASFGLTQNLIDTLTPAIAPIEAVAEFGSSDEPIIWGSRAPSAASMDAGILAAANFASAASAPLIDGKELVGMLVVLSREPRGFDHDAANFLQVIGNQFSAAMQRIRMEEQLAHAQRLEAVGQLTGGIAHDFNNLLTVISGNLEILECGQGDESQGREAIRNALRAVGRGAELTRKLLAFARRQRLSPVAISPRSLLNELGAMLRRTLGETIELEIACPDDIPVVYADPGQLEGALVNLALNARDAMPRGGRLRIGASLRERSEASADTELMSRDHVVFAVRDTGIGMLPEVLARAFEPFFTTKETGKGSGLGLSMVYGFVKQSGGHVTADSRLGYGTSIELHLPIAKSIVEEPTESEIIAHSRGQQTILVVEDEAEVRGIAVAFLRSAGYTIHSAENAEAALTWIASEPSIALVFSDVVLSSGMSGVELAREIRRRRPELPVLLTSGYEGALADAEGETASEFELLRKPYRRQALLTAVHKALGSP